MAKENKKVDNKPVYTTQDFPVQASVWKKDIKVEKKTMTVYNTKIVTVYKDEEGEYKETSNFKEMDLLRLSNVALRTYNWILIAKDKAYKDSKADKDEDEEDEDED